MRHSRAFGFSMVELMATIAIVAILLAVAFPSFESAMRSNRVATASNELMASFSLARSEAIRSPTGSYMCTSTAGTACDVGSTWDDGWIVWIDRDEDDVLDADDRVVRYVEANEKLNFSATVTGGGSVTEVHFDPRGRMVDNVTHTITLMPVTCPADQALIRTVALNATGQVKISKGPCT